MESTQSDEKLKALETSLAQELDQSVVVTAEDATTSTTSVVQDPNAHPELDKSGNAHIQPITVADPSGRPPGMGETVPSGPTSKGDGDEIKLDSLDKILADEDPSFSAELEAIRAGVKDQDVSIEEKDLLGTVEEGLSLEPETALRGFLNSWRARIQMGRNRIEHLFLMSFRKSLVALKDFILEIGRQAWSEIRSLQVRHWLLVFGYCGILGLMGYLVKSSQLLMGLISAPDFVGSFEDVADSKINVSGDKDFRLYNDPLDEFDYIVQYNRMIVNLKRSQNSMANPMATFVIFLVGTSRESAIELKDRESQVRDICQRMAEGLSYDEFISAEGKKRFKLLVRKEVNKILNQGHLRAIYFDTILIKP